MSTFSKKNLHKKVMGFESVLETYKNQLLIGSLMIGVIVLSGPLRIGAVAGLVVYAVSSLAAERNVKPHPSIGWKPFLGNDGSILKDFQTHSLKTMKRLSTECNFQNFDLHFVGGVNFVFLFDERDRMFLLKDNWTAFTKSVPSLGIGWQATQRELFGHGIFASDGDSWSASRKAASHMFSAFKMKSSMEVVFKNHTATLVSILKEKARTGEVVDLQLLLSSFTFDTMNEISFGIDTGALKAAARNKKTKFLVAFDQAQLISINRFRKPPAQWKLARFLQMPEEAELTEHIAYMRGYLQTVIEERRHEINGTVKPSSSRRVFKRASANRKSVNKRESKRQSSKRSTKSSDFEEILSKRSSKASESVKRESAKRSSKSGRESTKTVSTKITSRGDLLSLYIEYANATNNPAMAEDASLQDMIINMLIAGRDTTSCLLTHCFNALDKNPQIQEKLVNEFSQVFLSSDEVTLDGIKGCNYADAVFNETLRTTPPVSSDARYANKDVTFPSGLKVKQGWTIGIPIINLGRDKSTWGEDAEEYRPERWLEWNNGKHLRRIPIERLPGFWGGPRACIGKDMARFEAKIVMEALTKEFNIKVVKPLVGEYSNGPVMFFKDGLHVTVELRE